MPKSIADKVALGAWAVPDNATVVAPEPLSAKTREPEDVPLEVEVKVTETVQLPLTGIVVQLLVCAKFVGVVVLTLETTRGDVPVLVRVTTCAALVVFVC